MTSVQLSSTQGRGEAEIAAADSKLRRELGSAAVDGRQRRDLGFAATTDGKLRRGLGLAAAGASLLAAGGIGALGYALLVEPQNIGLERLTIRLPGAAGRLPKEGLRILHLSDSHFSGREWREQGKLKKVKQLVQGLEYDLLVHTGDFVHFDSGVPNVEALLDSLPKPRLGAFGVFGNHDYTHYNMKQALPRMWRTFAAEDARRTELASPLERTYLRATRFVRYVRYVRNTPLDGPRIGSNDSAALTTVLAQHGMHVLHNQVVHLHDPQVGLDLYLAGIDDVYEGRPRLGETLDCVPQGAPVVLLSHNPDIIASPRLDRIDLVIAGHTHGGQLVLPLWGPAHTQSAYLPRRNVAGHFQHGRTEFYITRGMGEGIPLRFNAKPQIALITLTA
jgi:predicted MPP superfamily phosphohydrolase